MARQRSSHSSSKRKWDNQVQWDLRPNQGQLQVNLHLVRPNRAVIDDVGAQYLLYARLPGQRLQNVQLHQVAIVFRIGPADELMVARAVLRMAKVRQFASSGLDAVDHRLY